MGEVKTTRANIQFAPDILRRLGEELNPSPDQGILELAKNSYDADAIECTVEIVDDGGNQSIRIVDDGDGMDGEDIETGWLVLGRSSKEVKTVTRLGRRPSGNKGLGRLAALRLGRKVLLISRPRESNREFRLEIDWERFDSAKVVEDVELKILESTRERDSGNGTTIEIQKVRAQIDRSGASRLAREMLLLADPFQDNPEGFQPVLKAREFEDVEKRLKKRYFDEAEFHLTATIDGKGKARASVTDYRGGVLFSAEHGDIAGKDSDQPYRCPEATFDLWMFVLDSKTFTTRSIALKDVQDWLAVVGGVHLYLRGLRLLPYGQPGHDWLEMNLRRVRNPELRPSTNTSVGRIRVEDLEETLAQKTDRSGLIENESYRELKRFAQDTLDWLASERLALREKSRTDERATAKKTRKAEEQEINRVVYDLPANIRKKVERRLKKFKTASKRERKTLVDEVQLYRTLSTAGINAETFAHEAGHPIKTIRDNTKVIEQRGKNLLDKEYESQLAKPVSRIRTGLDSLEAFTKISLDYVKREKRRRTRVDLHATIQAFAEAMNPLLLEREIRLDLHLAKGTPVLFASEAAIDSILANHLLNSVKALIRKGVGKRVIEISTEAGLGKVLLEISDNGPGIKDIPLAKIWLPGESSDPNGTGLGLTIVRDTVADLGGKVSCTPKGKLGGAQFHIELPLLEWGQ